MNEMMGLPLSNIEETPIDTKIDMAKLSFNVSKDKQVNAAMIYIRNMDIKGIFVFDNCNYEQKEEYLLKYMTLHDLRADSIFLLETWLCILTHGYIDIKVENTILTDKEIDKFCNSNKELIYEIRRLIISIPLVSIDYYKQKSNIQEDIKEFDISQYEHSTYYSINMSVFVKLLDFDQIILLQQIIDDITPVWYDRYFDSCINKYYGNFLSKFPYLDLLNLFRSDNISIQNIFINELNDFLEDKLKEDKSNNESDELP